MGADRADGGLMMSSSTRRAVLLALGGSVATILLVAVSTSGQVAFFARYPSISWDREVEQRANDTSIGFVTAEEDVDVFKIWEVDLPDVVATILQIILVAAAIAIVIQLWTRRPRLQWRRARPAEDFDVLDDLARRVAADAEAQRQALTVGAPRNAIVACWLRLETVTAEAGFDRRPADTSEEFTSRILHRFAVDPAAVDQLAGLYREARFSSHEMGEDDRSTAIEMLDAIHQGLQTSQDTPA